MHVDAIGTAVDLRDAQIDLIDELSGQIRLRDIGVNPAKGLYADRSNGGRFSTAHRAEQIEDLLALFQALSCVAEKPDDAFDRFFHAMESGEGRMFKKIRPRRGSLAVSII